MSSRKIAMGWTLAGSLMMPHVGGCNALTGHVRVGDHDTGTEEGTGERIDELPSDTDDGRADGGAAGPGDDAPQNGHEFVSPLGLPTGVVIIGEHVFNVEVAATREAQLHGLMERESLAPDAGMLFVFDQPEIQSFWMLNTPLPLDVAFIRQDLTISSTDTMEPLTTTRYVSVEAVPYVLEVPAGEFARRGIKAGDVISVVLNE